MWTVVNVACVLQIIRHSSASFFFIHAFSPIKMFLWQLVFRSNWAAIQSLIFFHALPLPNSPAFMFSVTVTTLKGTISNSKVSDGFYFLCEDLCTFKPWDQSSHH